MMTNEQLRKLYGCDDPEKLKQSVVGCPGCEAFGLCLYHSLSPEKQAEIGKRRPKIPADS